LKVGYISLPFESDEDWNLRGKALVACFTAAIFHSVLNLGARIPFMKVVKRDGTFENVIASVCAPQRLFRDNHWVPVNVRKRALGKQGGCWLFVKRYGIVIFVVFIFVVSQD
jgi:hypothetical protein